VGVVVSLKEKLLLLSIAVTLVMLTFAPMVKAYASVRVYGYTDKTQYMLGETGTLKLWVYNDGTEDVILKNVTIEYPWHQYYIWEGNETISDINTAILVKGNWSSTRTFTVPSDGRAVGGSIHILVMTDKVIETEYIPIDVARAPSYRSLQDMDKLTSLFTIQVVLLIVCTIIIAATIFLSARRPQVTWKAEEKGQ